MELPHARKSVFLLSSPLPSSFLEVINGASKTNGIRRPQRMPSLLPKTTQGKDGKDEALQVSECSQQEPVRAALSKPGFHCPKEPCGCLSPHHNLPVIA